MLKPPGQVANALDWSKKAKTVATLHVGKERIGMAIASHPDFGEAVQPILPPVKLQLVTTGSTNNNSHNCNRLALAQPTIRELQDLCDEHNVGSFVVVWPLQKEGRPGAACGKVLHTLESLISESDAVLTKSRPICLFTSADMIDRDVQKQYAEDEWGRCAIYARTSQKTYYCASTEQYQIPSGCSFAAAKAWSAFCRQHWPEFCVEQNDHDDDDDDVRYAAAAGGKVSSKVADKLFSGRITVGYSQQRILSMQLT